MKLSQRLALCLRIIRARPNNLYAHAECELAIALPDGPTDADDSGMNAAMRADVLEMVLIFGTQGHSGMSASYAIDIVKDVLAYRPLAPLTGGPEEWTHIDQGFEMLAQNKRCGHVFMRENGTCYDSTGKIFEEPNGLRYQSGDSAVDITFPYTPTTEIVKREFAT